MIPNLNSYSKGRNLFIFITLILVLEDMNLTEVEGTGKIMLGTTKIYIIWNLLRKTNYINIVYSDNTIVVLFVLCTQ